MASDFPGRPLLLKGALIVFETPVPAPTNIIIFQYNPEAMTRRLTQPGADLSGQSADARLNAGDTKNVLQTPIESYSLSVELDAADQLEENDVVTRVVGLHPALAALELLLYPSSRVTVTNQALADGGSMMIVAPQLPLVLLVWGAMRIVPVQVTSVSITETAFDQILNPIQAKVDLEMRSLTDTELMQANRPFSTLGMVNHIAKEALARFQIGGLVAKAEVATVRGLLPF
jgi:hypothetical protein